MQAPDTITITEFTADEFEQNVGAFTEILHACVHAGASVNFIMPFSESDAERFWISKVLPALRSGERLLLGARLDGRLVGTVQLAVDTPPNQPHRAEVSKLLVHPDFRRRGMARALMDSVERLAAERHRTLLTLDTRTGDHAEPLYASIGYQTVGVIPGYCRDPFLDHFDGTTIMYKTL